MTVVCFCNKAAWSPVVSQLSTSALPEGAGPGLSLPLEEHFVLQEASQRVMITTVNLLWRKTKLLYRVSKGLFMPTWKCMLLWLTIVSFHVKIYLCCLKPKWYVH